MLRAQAEEAESGQDQRVVVSGDSWLRLCSASPMCTPQRMDVLPVLEAGGVRGS